MKTVKFLFVALFALTLGICSNAQMHDHSAMGTQSSGVQNSSEKTESIFVNGKCDMCKTRIENAANLKGVSYADWNTETHILTLVYNPSVINSNDVQKSISAAGHDTGKYKATDEAYNSLPSCCKYDRNAK